MASRRREHVRRISSALNTRAGKSTDNQILQSWRRSASSARLDPASEKEVRILASPQLARLRDQSSAYIEAARPEIDRLYRIVRPARYVVLLTDKDGAVIDHRGAREDAPEFKRWGLWLGRIWSEGAEGTNAIGTALVDLRPTTVHRTEHFRARHIGLSCSAAPIVDGESNLVGALDISTFDPAISDHAHALTGGLTTAFARRIEERMFRSKFHRQWIIALFRPDSSETGVLLAINNSRRIVAANRAGRALLVRSGQSPERSPSLWTVFSRNDSLFSHGGSDDAVGLMTCATTGDSCPALVTPPLPGFMAKFMRDPQNLYCRPRFDTLHAGIQPPVTAPRLGLTQATLRRVGGYVDNHLDGDLSVEILAGVAGLSASHFARAFKKSSGKTPYWFVLERRLAEARRLLRESSLPLAEVAMRVGFADQSHFARRFRQQAGVAPSQFRKSLE
ncbi:MAG TPA: helix-turn-helix domain-containing protein [Reyranella sp.]|nr:helix-turn-helix domain-containing protein [Reyranella sp.]